MRVTARRELPGRRKTRRLGVLLLAVTPLVLGLGLFVGTADISMGTALKVLFRGLLHPAPGEIAPSTEVILFHLRIPRLLLALITGAALGLSGGVLQCLFRNPMADPYVMGLSSGAAFGVALGVVAGMAHPLLLQLSSFTGAMVSVILVLGFAGLAREQGNPLVILISGIAVSLFFTSAMSLVMYLNRDQTEKILFWTFGSLSGSSWRKILMISGFILPGMAVLLSQWKRLNLLSQGDDTARSLGIDPRKSRILLLILTSFITSLAVSVTGIIGFVGLMIPHIIRMLNGPDHRSLLPLSAAGGALYLVLADTLSRVLLSPTEIPVGIITSLIGAPYLFLVILMTRRARR